MMRIRGLDELAARVKPMTVQSVRAPPHRRRELFTALKEGVGHVAEHLLYPRHDPRPVPVSMPLRNHQSRLSLARLVLPFARSTLPG